MCGTFKKWQFSVIHFFMARFLFIRKWSTGGPCGKYKVRNRNRIQNMHSCTVFSKANFSAEKVRLLISFCTAVHSPVGTSDFDRFHNSMSGTTFCNTINKLRLVYK
jgi:hypothetical protein